ncbi:hypothetical protein [uncultured Lutibacter sp.]|uniref:hypothetical protein n=1 Tax=uncultured Lutibacter sp. TaxID=437739 RepID=UPI00260A5FE2|nr:hypothetical protein [uncultured Lutibacter sp.]
MKNLKLNGIILVITVLTLSSCSQRLVDFTVISSKNHAINFDLEQGKITSGKSMGVFGIGTNIKDAMDTALQNAGPQYDILINGVVRAKSYPFYGGFIVEGTAVSSKQLIALFGEDGFEKWKNENNIFSPTAVATIE